MGYISCEWALNYHGLLFQSPTVCTVLTLSIAVGAERRTSYQTGYSLSRIGSEGRIADLKRVPLPKI